MILLTLVIVASLIVGAFTGDYLAKQGVTADQALQRHQKRVYRIACLVLGVGVLLGVIGRSPWMPTLLLLYIGGYWGEFILAVIGFCAGLFLFLELPGWKDTKRLQQLLVFLLVSSAAITFLIWQKLPITSLLQAPRVLEGVVLQTTSYSCAAASIATLAQIVNPTVQVTERDVVELAQTSRQGTSTLAEIAAMQQLGLMPDYQRNLQIEDLVARRQLAILHVMEPVAGTRIAHAIVLLGIDPIQRTLTLGNPIYGKQVKTFDEMKDYWLKEAIFVTGSTQLPVP